MNKMFKQLTTGLALMTSAIAFSQVGINTQTPHVSADLELASTNKALYLNRVEDPENDIADPQSGMILYDTTMKCVRIYQGNPPAWSLCLGLGLTVGEGSIDSFNCAAAVFAPSSVTQGQPYSGTLSIPYTGGNGGNYPEDEFTVGGLTFALPEGSYENGDGTLEYNIAGTPTASGSISVDVYQNGGSCTGLLLPVNSPAPTNPAGTGSLAGKTCFDVVEVFVSNECGTIESRMPQKADFSQTATNTQTYTFTPSGTVSNVRFVYVNTNGQVIQSISGGNPGNNITTPVNATVVYYSNLNTAAEGLSREQALLADIYVIYNDNSTGTGTDRQLKLTARVQDCACCGAPTNTGGYLYFMCHNLGADETADPFTPSWQLNGGYIQWGQKGPDNWQTSGNTSVFAAAPTGTSAAQANSGNISGWANPGSGVHNYPTNSWNSGTAASPIKTVADPCPTGYRVPTHLEWNSILVGLTSNWVSIGTWTNSATNYSSGKLVAGTLYLPAAGYRSLTNGSLLSRGSYGHYWASTTLSVGTGNRLEFNSSSVTQSGSSSLNAAYASPVRCVQQ